MRRVNLGILVITLSQLGNRYIRLAEINSQGLLQRLKLFHAQQSPRLSRSRQWHVRSIDRSFAFHLSQSELSVVHRNYKRLGLCESEKKVSQCAIPGAE
jgi:hypothetical protein